MTESSASLLRKEIEKNTQAQKEELDYLRHFYNWGKANLSLSALTAVRTHYKGPIPERYRDDQQT